MCTESIRLWNGGNNVELTFTGTNNMKTQIEIYKTYRKILKYSPR